MENKNESQLEVNCPTCAKPILWVAHNKYRPFCCERCRMIDLGQWVNDTYYIIDDSIPDL